MATLRGVQITTRCLGGNALSSNGLDDVKCQARLPRAQSIHKKTQFSLTMRTCRKRSGTLARSTYGNFQTVFPQAKRVLVMRNCQPQRFNRLLKRIFHLFRCTIVGDELRSRGDINTVHVGVTHGRGRGCQEHLKAHETKTETDRKTKTPQ